MALEQVAVAVLFWLVTNEYVPLAVPPVRTRGVESGGHVALALVQVLVMRKSPVTWASGPD